MADPLTVDEEAEGNSEPQRSRPATHIAFLDESHQNLGRYRSVAMVSTSKADEAYVRAILARPFTKSTVKEFKWTRLAGARYRLVALAMIKELLWLASTRKVRADILIWDTHDRRHRVSPRDDVRNLEIMSYHLIRNGCAKRWPGPKRWDLRPDENSVQWELLKQILEGGDGAKTRGQNRLISGFRSLPFEVHSIIPQKSHDEILIQYADFLAGLGIFSKHIFDQKAWEVNGLEAHDLHVKKHRQERFGLTPHRRVLTNSEVERIVVLKEFVYHAERHGWRFALRAAQGLRSWHQWPINFWHYRPKNIHDRAPTKPPEAKAFFNLLRPDTR